LGDTLVTLSASYRSHYRQSLGHDGVVLHDAVAVAEAIRPGLLRTTRMPVEVDCGQGPARGMTIGDRRTFRTHAQDAPREIDVALDADLDEVREFLLSRLT
jgi:pyrimidine-specific ribonucleoside hydrolase